MSQCLKITEKVTFNIASEASYVYILSGQKFIKNGQFWRLFENLKLAVKQCYQTGQFQWDKNLMKMPKLKNSNETFWVIFKHCVPISGHIFSSLWISAFEWTPESHLFIHPYVLQCCLILFIIRQRSLRAPKLVTVCHHHWT